MPTAAAGCPQRIRPDASCSSAAAAGQELGYHFRVQDGASGGDPAQGVEEVRYVGHPVFEQVPDGAGLGGQQVGGVALLDVLGQDQDGGLRVLAADDQRGLDALVGVGGRHPHVDHDQVRAVFSDRAQ